MKIRKKIQKIKRESYPKLLKRADAVFSKWIRTRDKWTCMICGVKENIQCGHLIPRGKKSVRFDEENCNAICGNCNWNDNYWHYLYEVAWLKKYGAKAMIALSERANVRPKKIPRERLEEIIKIYSL